MNNLTSIKSTIVSIVEKVIKLVPKEKMDIIFKKDDDDQSTRSLGVMFKCSIQSAATAIGDNGNSEVFEENSTLDILYVYPSSIFVLSETIDDSSDGFSSILSWENISNHHSEWKTDGLNFLDGEVNKQIFNIHDKILKNNLSRNTGVYTNIVLSEIDFNKGLFHLVRVFFRPKKDSSKLKVFLITHLEYWLDFKI